MAGGDLVLEHLAEFGVRQRGAPAAPASGGPGRGEKEGAGRALHQPLAHGVADEIVDERAVAEAHLGLRRVHVDVHLLRVALEEQQRERIRRRRHQVVIRRGERVQQQAVANQAAVDEDEDRIAIALLHLRAREEAAQAERARARLAVARLRVGRQQQSSLSRAPISTRSSSSPAAEHLVDALLQGRDRRDVQQLGRAAGELQGLVGMRQAVVRHQRGDVRQLGLLGAQKFLARGDVVEEIADRDAGAAAERRLLAAQHLAAGDLDARAGGLLLRARFEQQPRDRRDRRQRLAAKAERRDGEQVLHVAQLAGGVAFEGEQRVVAQHAAAIVDDADEAPSAGFDLDAQLGRAGVERVFEQLLDDRGRALHDFAGGDLVGDLVGENADAAHRREGFDHYSSRPTSETP